ncbi:hypothetical protein CV102_04045 [Natronococcus pandeyae]|uniref:Pyrrolo-quinoline quinone repeat domain-containing protein n=1 Tax=Natronococcus pandeyae TaxID=2055836 RepID=A0A8J8Q302_9EURY|nr:PQQ-binding-like beta-propeller repeat protein [Natronococcus pandeyae]TYL39476.1 hypothetical protein CV102_04045 [Natronococcus pandeyae]
MSEWHRRSVLATGAALSIGGLASVGAGADGPDVEALPDPDVDPNPETDEDWPSFNGDAGHARYVRDGHEFDGDDLEVAWSVEHGGSVAVADDTVFTTTGDGVVALDAADGSVVWKNTDVDASSPSVVGDTVYFSGSEVVALDVSDGSVRWKSDLDPEEPEHGHPIHSHTVAYEAVYVVADDTLYALETDDGSVRWDSESTTIGSQNGEEYEFDGTTAAANGVVYAAAMTSGSTGVKFALEPETGAEVWRTEWEHYTGSSVQARATSAGAVLGHVSYYARHIYDPQTGETIVKATSEGIGISLGEEIYVGGYEGTSVSGSSIDGDEYGWEHTVRRNVRRAVIGSDTVYVYFREHLTDDTYTGELVAFDKYDGSEKWTIAKSELPVGEVRAISGDTLYVEHDDDLVALRETTDEDGDESDDEDDQQDDGDEQDDEEGQEDGGDEDQQGDEQPEEGDEPDDGDGDDEADDGDGDEEPEDGEDTDDDGATDDGGTGDENGDSDDGDDDDKTDDEAEFEGGETGDDEDGGEDSSGDDGTDDEPEDQDTDDEESEDDDAGLGDDDADDGDQADDGATDDEDEADDVPGFTTGAGIVGGAVGLEWLRRKADADEPTE